MDSAVGRVIVAWARVSDTRESRVPDVSFRRATRALVTMRFDPKEKHFSISMSTKTTARFARRTPVRAALVSFAPLAIESYRPNQPFFLGFSFAAFPSGALSASFLPPKRPPRVKGLLMPLFSVSTHPSSA